MLFEAFQTVRPVVGSTKAHYVEPFPDLASVANGVTPLMEAA